MKSGAAAIAESASLTAATGSRLLTPLFGATLFTSAALVFVAEPMFGKMVLPLLGGSPAVWNTCMVFFQAVLLAGYGYAHLLTTRTSLRTQVVVHVGVLLLALFALPVAIPAGWVPPVDRSPIASLVTTLLLGVGGPLFVLSATAPLLQKWFSCTTDRSARDPYFLYAASNVGSILALLAYPLVIEPSSSLSAQSARWSAGYMLLIVLTVICGAAARRGVVSQSEISPDAAEPVSEHAPVTWRRRRRWLALSLVPSSLMLAVTTYVSTDVAAVPLLWTIPLALYLLSFIFGFAAQRVIPGRVTLGAAVAMVLVLVLAMSIGITQPVWFMLVLHLAILFVLALTLHSELADDRPDTRNLTEFYLWIAVGGVMGGLFNTLIAPILFTRVAEYPIAIAAAVWLIPATSLGISRSRLMQIGGPLVAGLATAALVLLMRRFEAPPITWAPVLGLVIVAYLFCALKPVQYGAAVSLMLIAGAFARPEQGQLIYAKRSFFGVHRVWDVPEHRQHRLSHGTTFHGGQHTEANRLKEPISYYHPAGPIGQVFTALSSKLNAAHVGVVGLGAGGLAAYAQTGQRWTFYEIDPAVERIARDARFFTYLRDCGSDCNVVLGDARLSLARADDVRYRLLVVDAFSSDAIPVHLMTREAMGLYLDRLTADGVLVFHISNRHLNLRPLVAGIAAEHRLVTYAQRFRKSTPDQVQTASEWVAMARTPAALNGLDADPRWTRLSDSEGMRVWTDDFSDILGVLRPL